MPTLNLDPQIEKQLKEEHLRYISEQSHGFLRQRVGKGFKFYDLEGKQIHTKDELDRIKSLGIPPAWKNVWICPQSNGHIQATGVDQKARKQYIYHPGWIAMTQQNKFDEMIGFGLSLPKIRQKVDYDLSGSTMDKKKILATVVWLLEHTFIRIGNEEYAKENDSFGLTTLRNKHAKVKGNEITFQFKGKSGVFTMTEVTNHRMAKIIKHCIELPGYNLFQYIDDNGNRHTVDSEDVNLFLKDITKNDFSAKDFRTWGATSLCAKNFFDLGFPPDLKLLKKNIKTAVKNVSTHLNNTVSVCKNYYIHPAVLRSYENNTLIPHFKKYSNLKKKKDGLFWNELALIKLLQKP